MQVRNKRWLSMAASALAAGLFCGAATAADLLSIYKDALANDAQLASAAALREANLEKLPQAKAAFFPTIGAQAQASKQKTDTSIAGTSTNRSTTPKSVSLSLTQPLFRPAAWVNYEQAKLLASQAELQYVASQQSLILRAAQAYFDVLGAQDVLTALAIQKRAIAEQLESAKRNFEVGTATITDQQEAQSRYDLVIAQEIAAQNDLQVKQAALEVLIGKPAPTLATLRKDTELTAPSPAVLDTWVNAAQTGNIQVQTSQLSKEIASRDIQKAKTGHLPTLDLNAQIGKSQQSVFTAGGQATADINSSSIGLSLAIPIFAGGLVNSQVRQTESLLKQSEQDLLNTTRTAALTTRQTFVGVQSGLAQIKALQAAEKSSQLALESNKLGYEVGVRINIDVLNAQQQLATTQRDLAKAKYDTLLNGLKLRQAAGSLKAEDLAEINATLQE